LRYMRKYFDKLFPKNGRVERKCFLWMESWENSNAKMC
jgi:uncharacterized membrane protein YhaH (DUF805 family)